MWKRNRFYCILSFNKSHVAAQPLQFIIFLFCFLYLSALRVISRRLDAQEEEVVVVVWTEKNDFIFILEKNLFYCSQVPVHCHVHRVRIISCSTVVSAWNALAPSSTIRQHKHAKRVTNRVAHVAALANIRVCRARSHYIWIVWIISACLAAQWTPRQMINPAVIVIKMQVRK